MSQSIKDHKTPPKGSVSGTNKRYLVQTSKAEVPLDEKVCRIDFSGFHTEKVETAEQKVAKKQFTEHQDIIYEKMIKYGIKFQNNLSELQEFLESNEDQILFLSNSHSSIFSSIKFFQTLMDNDTHKRDGSFIFLRHELMTSYTSVLEAFESARHSNLLVIEFSKNTDEMDHDTFGKFCDILNNNKRKQIVFITTKGNRLPQTQINYKIIEDSTNAFTDLITESQERLYAEAKVYFQGHKVKMNELLRDNFKLLFNEEILLKIVNGEVIEIGTRLPICRCYIARKLKKPIINLPYYGCPSNLHIITISNANPKPHQDLVLKCDDEDEFVTLCSQYKNRNVHWITKDNVWQKSQGLSILKLRRYLDYSHLPSEEIYELKEKVSILSAPPGSGKSIQLTQLANSMKTADPYLWVMRVNLIEISSALEKYSGYFGGEITGNFLREIFWSKSKNKKINPFEATLFDSCYELGKVVLFLDGFDEICHSYKKKVIEILKLISISKVHKLCVATRPNRLLAELEDELLSFSYTFEELRREDKLNMLTGIWDSQNQSFTEEQAEKLLDFVQKLGLVLSNPLQIYLVATIWKGCLDPVENSLKLNAEKFNLADLYEEFYNYSFHKVYKSEQTTVEYLKIMQTKSKILHQHLALHTLLGKDYIPNLFSNKFAEILKFDKENSQMAIIERISDGGPVFVHRPFAEFFFALWMADEEIWKKPDIRYNFKCLFKTNAMLRQFFGHIIAKNTTATYASAYPIHVAVMQNDEATLEDLLKQLKATCKFDGKINEQDELMQLSPLECAVEFEDLNMVEILLKNGANGEVLHKYCYHSSLSWANYASQNNLELFKLLAKDKSQFDFTKFFDLEISFLHKAVKNDAIDVVKNMLASLNVVQIIDVLHYAVRQSALKVVDYLLGTSKMDLNLTDQYGNTLLHTAAIANALKVVEYLVETHNFFVNVADRDGQTPLHLAARNDGLQVVKYLIEQQNVNLNVKNRVGQTPLHLAASEGALGAVKYFLEQRNVDPNIKDQMGQTPLHLAARNNSLKVLKYLIEEKNVAILIENNEGQTPLHSVASTGALRTLKYLIDQQKLDLNAKDRNGQTPLHLAVRGSALEIVKYLLEQFKVDINIKDGNGQTPLQLAVSKDALHIVQYLLNEHTLSVAVHDAYDETPLHLAVRSNATKVTQYLINNQNFNVQNIFGQTPLHLAVSLNAKDVVYNLVEQPFVNVKVKDRDGQTPLHLAAYNGALDIVKYLVEELNVDSGVQNQFGQTPLDLAVTTGASDVIAYLNYWNAFGIFRFGKRSHQGPAASASSIAPQNSSIICVDEDSGDSLGNLSVSAHQTFGLNFVGNSSRGPVASTSSSVTQKSSIICVDEDLEELNLPRFDLLLN